MISITTTVFSTISAVASALCSVFIYQQTVKINKFFVNKNYHSKIFDEFLISRLPLARQDIKFDGDGKLICTQKFVDELSNLRNSALFYKYHNQSFYDEIKKHTQSIEDYVMDLGNVCTDQEEQSEKLREINGKTILLYEIISDQVFEKI